MDTFISGVIVGLTCLRPGRANMVLAALAFVPIWALVYPEGLAWPFLRSRREIRAAIAQWEEGRPAWEVFVNPRALPGLRWAIVASLVSFGVASYTCNEAAPSLLGSKGRNGMTRVGAFVSLIAGFNCRFPPPGGERGRGRQAFSSAL